MQVAVPEGPSTRRRFDEAFDAVDAQSGSTSAGPSSDVARPASQQVRRYGRGGPVSDGDVTQRNRPGVSPRDSLRDDVIAVLERWRRGVCQQRRSRCEH